MNIVLEELELFKNLVKNKNDRQTKTMYRMPYVHMPDYFTFLLSNNIQIGSEFYLKIPSYINSNKSLQGIIEYCFSDIDRDLRPDMILKIMGPGAFCNRLASIFVYFQRHGHYPKEFKFNYISNILSIEDQLRTYSVDGHSRGLLLGLYLELGIYAYDDKSKEFEENQKCFDHFNLSSEKIGELVKLLKKGKGKTIKIDWLIVTLGILSSMLPVGQLLDLIGQSKSYSDLYEGLDGHNKRYLVANLLSYGSSIGDYQFFVGPNK